MGWRSIAAAPDPPRHWDASATGYYYYDLLGAFTGEPIGWRKLKRFRTISQRYDACDDFARLVSPQLPKQSVWTYMPSTTRHHCGIDPSAIEAMFRAALERHRSDIQFVEPLIRESPITSVHESRDRDIERLASTLKPKENSVRADSPDS